MKIVNILSDAACLLGLNEEKVLLDNLTIEGEAQILAEHQNVESLFSLIKLSLRELCTNYVPVTITKTVKSTDKKYAVSQLENFIRIQNVYQNEQAVKYKVINRNVVFEEDGEFEVNYATYPEISSMFEDIDFLQNFSPDAIVFGLCAYYCLAHGMFDMFEEFHDKYIERAESLKELKIFELPCRRWEWKAKRLLK